jgi:Smg protein
VNFRVLGPHERGRFAPEAWGHLLALNAAGALSAADLEHVIERALAQIDGRIALDDLRSLMEGAGFEDNVTGGDSQTVH